ncbi:MAG: biopolymer transporter ExbD [Deltaproteobacteria bacterium]|nr:biopolymer transporter ExbD [Deltaproteobacteria bacterium]
MAGGAQKDDEMITDINVTPLVDIMLVLLIIFMLTANLIMAPSIKVDLPNAVTGEGSEPSTIALTLTKDNKLYLNGKETSEEAVRVFVPAELEKKADLQAIIAADQEVPHGSVVHLIDLVRTLGISKFALNIEPQATR